MEKLIEKIGTIVLVLIIIFLVAVVSGTIVWATYPYIHKLFPLAHEKGIIAKELSWWSSVSITWFVIALFGKNFIKKDD